MPAPTPETQAPKVVLQRQCCKSEGAKELCDRMDVYLEKQATKALFLCRAAAAGVAAPGEAAAVVSVASVLKKMPDEFWTEPCMPSNVCLQEEAETSGDSKRSRVTPMCDLP